MKFEKLLALLLILLICSPINTTDKPAKPESEKGAADKKPPANDKGKEKGKGKDGKKKKKPKPIVCQTDVLHSYLLHGRKNASSEPMHLCPTIKNNCCTRMDQQRIYHIVKEFLPQRLLEYQSKIRMALAKLRELHIKINRASPTFTGKPARRLFCHAQVSILFNFPFFRMYNEIMEYLDIIRDELNDYYSTFFCQICDADNHKYIKTKEKQIQMNEEFCQDMIGNHSDAIKIFNVDLINYMHALQNVVDCTHYVKSYKLEFFDTSKDKMRNTVGKCITEVQSKKFMQFCKPICDTLKVSKVIETIEGDFEFVIDAVNLFEKFFEYKESGSFISSQLRAFFKRFVVPRSQSRKQVYKFLHDVEYHMLSKKERLKHIRKKMMKPKAKGKAGPKKPEGKSSSKAAPRKLLQINNKKNNFGEGLKQLIPTLPDIESNKKTDSDSGINNKLVIDPSSQIQQRVLAAAAGGAAKAKPAEKPKGKPGSGKKKVKVIKKQKKKYARLVLSQELQKFYNALHIRKPQPEERKILEIRSMPCDIDELKKVFMKEKGIDPRKYIGQTKFDMDQATLYRLLFNHVNNDKVDVELMLFLNDFTHKYQEEIYEDVDTPYKIEMEKKDKP